MLRLAMPVVPPLHIAEQAMETTQYLQRIAEFLDRAFGVAAARQRGSLLLP